MRNLQVLNLRRNSLSVLGDWTMPLGSLRVLDLSQNILVSMTERLGLRRLESLSLSDNMLVEVSDSALQELVSLSSLDLSYNKLSQFPAVAAVRELSLSGNMIKVVDEASLEGLGRLETLHLSNMPVLARLEPLSLMFSPRLTSLSLSNNRKLHPLPAGLFSTNPGLTSLDLSNLGWTSLHPEQLPSSPDRLVLSGIAPVSVSLSLPGILILSRCLAVSVSQCQGPTVSQCHSPTVS